METIPWTSTKKEIYQAYKEILSKYEDAIQNPPSARHVAREAEKKETIAQKAAQHTPESLIEGISRMKISISKTLDALAESLADEAKKLTELRIAKDIAQAELERISDSKVAAEALEMWLAEHEQRKADLLSELAEQKAELEAEIGTKRTAWEGEQSERIKQQKEEDLQRKKSREREEQEYSYNLKIQRKKDEDERNAWQAQFEREAATKMRALEDEISRTRQEYEREKDEIERLRQEAATWAQRLDETKVTTREEATRELSAKHANEISILRQKAESAAEISGIRIQTLETYLAKQEHRIEELSRKLEQETSRVHEIANKAVEGAAGATAFSAVNRIAVEQAKRPFQSGSEEPRR